MNEIQTLILSDFINCSSPNIFSFINPLFLLFVTIAKTKIYEGFGQNCQLLVLFCRSTVNWYLPDGGINKDVHRDYLSKFSSVFHNAVIKLIDKGAKTQETLARNELLMEVQYTTNFRNYLAVSLTTSRIKKVKCSHIWIFHFKISILK